MRKLHKQMRELVKCQGQQTKKFVEDKLNKFIDLNDIDLNELNKTLADIKAAINDDEDTFKLIDGIISTNKTKLSGLELSINSLSLKQEETADMIKDTNKKTKECLRIVEEDIYIDVSELCSIYGDALNNDTVSEDL